MPVDIQVCWFEALDGHAVCTTTVYRWSKLYVECLQNCGNPLHQSLYLYPDTVSSPVYIMKDAAALTCNRSIYELILWFYYPFLWF